MLLRLLAFFSVLTSPLAMGTTSMDVSPSTPSSSPSSEEDIAPRVVIILDDIGYRKSDLAALALPNEVIFSILPQTPLGQEIAKKAHHQGRDVMLHMPMESTSHAKMGPLGLSVDMYPAAITHTVRQAVKSVPHAIGVNNHMGSAFTANQDNMTAFMQEIRRQGLFFVDSRTSVMSTGQRTAQSIGVPNTRRHVFLDNHTDSDSLHKQFETMKRIARKQGIVVAIGHPHPATIAFLQREIPLLVEQGFQLAPVRLALNYPPLPQTSPSQRLASETRVAPQ